MLSSSLQQAAGYRAAAEDLEKAAALHEESLSLLRHLAELTGHDPSDCSQLVRGLWGLGHTRRRLGHLAAARAAYEEALALSR